MKYVFDSNAIIAFFEREEGAPVIREILLATEHDITMHSLNICEAFYHFSRKFGQPIANNVLKNMLTLGVESFDELDPTLWKKAAALKTQYRRLATGDAVGVALAMTSRSIFVTSDKKELSPLADDGVCKFLFFR